MIVRGNSDGSILVRWTDTPGSPNGLIGSYGIGGLTAAAMRVVLRGIGQTWGQSNASEQVTCGRVDEGHDATVPGLELSQSEFGIIDATLNASFFSPTMEQAMLIAQAYVAGNMWPVERFQVEQGPALPVYPDDIGRLIRLPNDVEGTVEAWQYSDAFSFDSAIVNSGFTIVRTLLPSAEDSAIESVTVHPGSVTVIEGGGLQLQAIVQGTGLYSYAVTWSSSDEAVATVNAFGAVTAVSVGTAVITATSVQDPTRSGTATVTVSEDEEIEE